MTEELFNIEIAEKIIQNQLSLIKSTTIVAVDNDGNRKIETLVIANINNEQKLGKIEDLLELSKGTDVSILKNEEKVSRIIKIQIRLYLNNLNNEGYRIINII